MDKSETMDPWIKASVISYILISIMNFIFVILKEENHGFKDSMVDIGKVFGNEHHLHGHIMLLIIVFAAVLLLLIYTPLNDMIADLIKMDDYQKAMYWIMGSTAITSLIILVYFYTIAF
ncbi:MAG: hypothetical protein KAR35_06295 [Candidatus Heimdallarchaeota archaeon]|nr:hypothetical protein [Candidatus Heimdallarchaeota archaeon]MCK5048969.1 hypothetical protein [Candidatus Heimdallarchaeota archaeon]